MSAVGTVTIIWRHGEDAFCLAKVGDILALEQKCNAGIMEIMGRLESQRWRLDDVRETIRLGLIGGGMSPEQALAVVKANVDENPSGLAPSVIIAHRILAAAIVGVPDDPVGKPEAAEAASEAAVSSTTTAASAAPASTESARPSDGRPGRSTTSGFGSWPPVSMATTPPTPQTT